METTTKPDPPTGAAQYSAGLRRRRAATLRLPPLEDGRRDPWLPGPRVPEALSTIVDTPPWPLPSDGRDLGMPRRADVGLLWLKEGRVA